MNSTLPTSANGLIAVAKNHKLVTAAAVIVALVVIGKVLSLAFSAVASVLSFLLWPAVLILVGFVAVGYVKKRNSRRG